MKIEKVTIVPPPPPVTEYRLTLTPAEYDLILITLEAASEGRGLKDPSNQALAAHLSYEMGTAD